MLLSNVSRDIMAPSRSRTGACRATRTRILETLTDPNSGCIMSLAWSPDGSMFVCGREASLQVWTTSTWTELDTLSSGSNIPRALEWSPDGSMFASTSDEGLVFIWSATSLSILQTLRAHTDWIYSMTWSPDGAQLSQDTTIKIWSTVTWEMLHVLTGHVSTPSSIDWSPDGMQLASGGFEVRIWSTTTWQEDQRLERMAGLDSNGNQDSVNEIAWSPDGTIMASASQRGLVLWDMSVLPPTFTDIVYGNDYFVYGVHAVAWRPYGSRLASGGVDAKVNTWEIHHRAKS